jgi:glycosyltransferase involved in cell wall biosynthesis
VDETRVNAPRVLVLGSVLAQPMGGVRRHNQELLPRAARLLRERGGSLSVLAGRDGVAFDLGPDIERLESSIPARPALARAALETHGVARALARASDNGRPFDVVHTAHLPAPRGLATPLTFTLHDLKSVFSRTAPRLRRWIGRCVVQDALDRSARVIAVSQTLRNELVEAFGAPPDKLAVVPNGADHLPLEPRKASADAPILFVGHLEPRKNVALLLRALALEPKLGELWLAGEGRADARSGLERLAHELGVAQRVKFLGLQSDRQLAELYATCRFVALPSLREGFDIPLVEALRAGAPVACSELAVHRELAGAAAAYFDPNDAAQFVRAAGEVRERLAPQVRLATWDDAARACVEAWVSARRLR